MRDEAALGLRSNAFQHDEGVAERAEQHPQRELIAAVADEVAQEPRPHLAGSKRQRGYGDREHGARDADRRASDRAEQGTSAGRAAIVHPTLQI